MAISGGIRKRMLAGLAACVICTMAGTARAQSADAGRVGIVRDSAGHPLRGAEVRLNGPTRLYAVTTDSGGFRFMALIPGATNVLVRRLGFAPETVKVILRAARTDSLVISLTSTAASLPGVLVEDEADARSHRLLAGFWERRSRGFGNFLTRDQIERRDAHDFVDLTRMIPSLRVVTFNGRPSLRFTRAGMLRDCPPQYVVDGLRIEAGSPDEFSPQDIEAIEIYSGPATTPPQFTNRPFSYTCGAIVIWTRLPGS